MTHIATTLDLNFRGIPGAIASYLLQHSNGIALIESGPGSTTARLEEALAEHGHSVGDVTDVFLTHIHLDHAGAAGWLAERGARIHVHPKGAPHLLDPERLIASATRIYGEMMGPLWGDFLPVPEAKLSVPSDGDAIEVGGLSFLAVESPGHANHHYAYLVDDVAFVGDVGGVRLGGLKYLRLPMPPPEFNIESWRSSIARLRREFADAGTRFIAPTHFGMYDDPDWQLSEVEASLDEVEAWMEEVMPRELPIEQLREEFVEWTRQQAEKKLSSDSRPAAQQAVNPPFMSADGILRYWKKHRQQSDGG